MGLIILSNRWQDRLIEKYEKEKKDCLPLSQQYLEGRVDMLKELDRHLLKDFVEVNHHG